MIKYQTILLYNTELIEQVTESAAYSHLRKALLAYNGNLWYSLTCITGYLLHYQEITGKKPEKNWGYASMDTLVSMYGGSKTTWSKNLSKLEVLGLIKVRNPRAGKSLTKDQQASVRRMYQQNHKWAVRYYRIPAYTYPLLENADQLSVTLNQTAVNKDSIRDQLGTEQANAITDTTFNITADTERRRSIIKSATMDLLEKGYTNQTEILYACEHTEHYTKHRWEQTYRAYKQLLFTELNLKQSKPTREEKALYGFVTANQIIRQVAPTTACKPTIEPIETYIDIWWHRTEDFVENGTWSQYEGCDIEYKQPTTRITPKTSNNSSLLKRLMAITDRYTVDSRIILPPIAVRYSRR